MRGRDPGVYDDWEDCRRQVHRFGDNNYKGYITRAEAETRYALLSSGREERDEEKPDEDHLRLDDARRDRVSVLCDPSLDS